MASVSVNISTINEPAILRGDLELKSNNKLKLTYIPIGTELSIGDMLYTSGLGSIYPNGIPVGKVVEVINKKNDIDRYAIVETSVNIRTISEVGIIIN
ncbi:rod shape-determining protein MreC [compost metagenome]